MMSKFNQQETSKIEIYKIQMSPIIRNEEYKFCDDL